MGRFFFLVALVLFFALFFGCVDYEVGIKLKENGKADLTIIQDFNTFREIADSSSIEEVANMWRKEKICETVMKNSSTSFGDGNSVGQSSGLDMNVFGSSDNSTFSMLGLQYSEMKCIALDDYKVKLVKLDSDLNADLMTLDIRDSNTKKTFVFALKKGDQNQIDFNNVEMTKAMLKQIGLRIIYNIEMPGKIKLYTIGTLSQDNKTVTINLVEELEKLVTDNVIVSEVQKEATSINSSNSSGGSLGNNSTDGASSPFSNFFSGDLSNSILLIGMFSGALLVILLILIVMHRKSAPPKPRVGQQPPIQPPILNQSAGQFGSSSTVDGHPSQNTDNYYRSQSSNKGLPRQY